MTRCSWLADPHCETAGAQFPRTLLLNSSKVNNKMRLLKLIPGRPSLSIPSPKPLGVSPNTTKRSPLHKSILHSARPYNHQTISLHQSNESPVGDVGGQRGSWGTQFPRTRFLSPSLVQKPTDSQSNQTQFKSAQTHSRKQAYSASPATVYECGTSISPGCKPAAATSASGYPS